VPGRGRTPTKIAAIFYKHSKKGGTNKSSEKITAILRVSNLQ
jgi:hypothetical protein